MPKVSVDFKRLRLEAALSQSKLARLADLDRATVAYAEHGRQVTELTVSKLAKALSEALEREVRFDDLLSEGTEDR